jgi:hypothetical protein
MLLTDLGDEAVAHRGSYTCANCRYLLAVAPGEEPPDCPRCGHHDFRTASLFLPSQLPFDPPEDDTDTDWLASVRLGLDARDGLHLAYRDAGEVTVAPLDKSTLRIGRGVAADIRLDDATVSRRHALLTVSAEGVGVFDDRSLNGVYVNGERIEEATLYDGDELVIGRFHLYLVDPVAAVVGARL